MLLYIYILGSIVACFINCNYIVYNETFVLSIIFVFFFFLITVGMHRHLKQSIFMLLVKIYYLICSLYLLYNGSNNFLSSRIFFFKYIIFKFIIKFKLFKFTTMLTALRILKIKKNIIFNYLFKSGICISTNFTYIIECLYAYFFFMLYNNIKKNNKIIDCIC